MDVKELDEIREYWTNLPDTNQRADVLRIIAELELAWDTMAKLDTEIDSAARTLAAYCKGKGL